jgi:hypothetical protein
MLCFSVIIVPQLSGTGIMTKVKEGGQTTFIASHKNTGFYVNPGDATKVV